MIQNYDESVRINHSSNWTNTPDHPYRVLIIRGSGLSNINALLNLIKHQRQEIDEIYLYIKDPRESKYQLLID